MSAKYLQKGDDSDDDDVIISGGDDPYTTGFLENNAFFETIKNMQDAFYAVNKKKTLFKKAQKEELTKAICSQLDINYLLSKMIRMGETNNIYFDYLIFKMFANADNYDQIITYCIKLFSDIIVKYGSYIIHVNLKSITVSAVERHQDFVRQFTRKCLLDGRHEYSLRLEMCNLYNSPSVLEMIKTMLKTMIEPIVMQKIRLV